MSDVGIGILLFVCILLAVGLIRFFSWLTELQEEYGSVPRAGLHAIQKYVSVKRYQVDDPAPPRVMSRETAQTDRQTKQAAQTEAEQWMARIEVDRTKVALIELLVYNGWGVGEIRNVIKGDSGALGQEVEAARQRLGLTQPALYRTPIANRPTAAQFQDDELEYRAPPV